jgi:hypothetical protein
MRNVIDSLMVLFSIYRCCYAYDSELSSYATSLVHESLCSISYATYVVRLVNLCYSGDLSSVLCNRCSSRGLLIKIEVLTHDRVVIGSVDMVSEL